MAAQFRIDQASPGDGIPDRSRHDLVAGEVIKLTAMNVGPGITHQWVLVDRVGSSATLSTTTGETVEIGPAEAIPELFGFSIKLIEDDNGTVTEVTREAKSTSANTGVAPLLFRSTANRSSTLDNRNPDDSTDNAVYTDLGGTGETGQNWAGWRNWAWLLQKAVENLAAGGGGGSGPKNKFDAISAPTSLDDAAAGYSVGSLWITPGDRVWVCMDPSEGDAEWLKLNVTLQNAYDSGGPDIVVSGLDPAVAVTAVVGGVPYEGTILNAAGLSSKMQLEIKPEDRASGDGFNVKIEGGDGLDGDFGGNVSVDAGSANDGGTVAIGTSNARLIQSGSGATPWTHDGSLQVMQDLEILGASLTGPTATTTAPGLMSSADKSKLDGVEAGADVTDSTNVAASGAVMTTRAINTTSPLAGGGALSSDLTLSISEATTGASGAMSSADKAKLDGIEAGADVTDATNVAAAGAVMTSRTISTTAPLAGGDTLASDITLSVATATPGAAGVAPPGTPIVEATTARTADDTDHGREILCTHASGCTVTVPDTVSEGLTFLVRVLGGQVTIVGSGTMTVVPPADMSAASSGEGATILVSVHPGPVCRVSGDLVYTGTPSVLESRTISTTAPLTGGGDLSSNRTLGISPATTSAAGSMSAADKSKLDGIEPLADVTDATNVAAAGAVMTSRTISTTAPLTGGANLSSNITLGIDPATTSTAGSMSAADKQKLDGIAAGADVTSPASIYDNGGMVISFVARVDALGNLLPSSRGVVSVGTPGGITEINLSDSYDPAKVGLLATVEGASLSDYRTVITARFKSSTAVEVSRYWFDATSPTDWKPATAAPFILVGFRLA